MRQLELYERRCGVTIRPRWMAGDVSLTIGQGRQVISYCAGLTPARALLAVMMMIEVLELGWPGHQFRIRFPQANDTPDLARATAWGWGAYHIPERRALRRLIPDRMLERAEGERWELARLAIASGLDEEACRRRVADWQASRRGIAWLGQRSPAHA